MQKVSLRKIRIGDRKYFAKWWRDKELLRATSGMLKKITDKEADEYFFRILNNRKDRHYLITFGRKAIGHISLEQRKNGRHEIQVVVGEKNQQNKGYGARAIKMLIAKARDLGISTIYLEVRPNNLRAIRVYEKCGFRKAGAKQYPKNKYLPQTIKMVLR